MIDIKPCPFCGHENLDIVHDTNGPGEDYYVACDDCNTEDKAVTAWNKRQCVFAVR